MTDLDTRPYLRFTLDATHGQIEQQFEQRFGLKPEKIERVIVGEFKGKEWGWWQAGPAPTLDPLESEK
jgi:hypothetical protein